MSLHLPIATYRTVSSSSHFPPIQVVSNPLVPKLNTNIKKYPKYKKVGSSTR